MSKSILFICEMPPIDTGASSVLFYRHLKMLENDGYKINVIVNEIGLKNSKSEIPKSWNTFILKNRKWWYPPYKPTGLFKQIRYFLIYFEIKNFLKSNKPNIIIGCLYGIYLSGFCAFLSKKNKIPLYMFYHDRAEQLSYYGNKKMQDIVFDNNSNVIEQANKIWTVSEQLVYDLPKWKNKFQVVFPIPQELKSNMPVWKNEFAAKPIIGYAGSLYNEIIEIMIQIAKILESLNGHFIILTHQIENAKKIKSIFPSTEIKESLSTMEACEYIQSNCSAFIVAYPNEINTMPWIESCFPSKFTQFIHTGIPILVVSPKKAAISIWCKKNNLAGYSENYDHKSLFDLFQLISTKSSWKQLSEQSIIFSQKYFNPIVIHSIIKSDLENDY